MLNAIGYHGSGATAGTTIGSLGAYDTEFDPPSINISFEANFGAGSAGFLVVKIGTAVVAELVNFDFGSSIDKIQLGSPALYDCGLSYINPTSFGIAPPIYSPPTGNPFYLFTF